MPMQGDPRLNAFRSQRSKARQRGIPFLFMFDEWWAWWQTDGRWERRGRGKDQLVMARIGDTGPYAPDNVRCLTSGQNMRDIRPEVRAAALEKSRMTSVERGHPLGCHLRVRGDGHPSSHAVITPAGRFGSVALAAEFHGFSEHTGRRWARNGWSSWRFADPDQTLLRPRLRPSLLRVELPSAARTGVS
jgi:hypothetical protein